ISLLDMARSDLPDVWIATLNEINTWWRRRSKLQINIDQEREHTLIQFPKDDRCAVLIQNPVGCNFTGPGSARSRYLTQAEWVCETGPLPLIRLTHKALALEPVL